MDLRDRKNIYNNSTDALLTPEVKLNGDGGLRDRKAINNGAFPKFLTGFDSIKFTPNEPAAYTPSTPNVVKPMGAVSVSDTAGKSNIGDVAGKGIAVAQGALLLGGNIANLAGFNKSADDLMMDAGTSTASIRGISTQILNDINKSAVLDEVNKKNFQGTLSGMATGASVGATFGPVGAAIGGVVGGIGSFIGGLFGKSAAKRRIAEAKRKANMQTQFAYSQAGSEALNQEWAERYGNSEDQLLYAKNGKDAGMMHCEDGKAGLVETAFGQIPGKQNSFVNKGEWIWDGEDNLQYVDHGPNDTAKAYLRGKDTVFTTKHGIADMVPYAAATGLLPQLAEYLKMIHMMGYKNGKDSMPKFLDGFDLIRFTPNEVVPYTIKTASPVVAPIGRLADGAKTKDSQSPFIPWYTQMPNILGMLTGIGQYFDAHNQKIKKSNSYVPNKYAEDALRSMAGRRYSAYPIADQLRRYFGYNNYTLTNSGGMSGAQKQRQRAANANSLYNNLVNMYTDHQGRNIALGQTYDQARLSEGAREAQARMSANQYDLGYYTKAHAAKQAGEQMGLYNFMNYMTNTGSDEFKRMQANYMMDLYNRRLNNDKLAILNSLG